MQLREQILVSQAISEKEALYESDGDNSLSVSYEMTEGNHTADKSQKSGHEDVTDGVYTSYSDLRQVIVTEKTVSQLLEFLNYPIVF